MLVDKGFSVGMVVHRKADDLEGTITAMTGSSVHLVLQDGSEKSASADSFLSGEWKSMKVKPPPQEFVDWKDKGINKDLWLSTIRGRVFAAFYAKDSQETHQDQLQLMLKPRGVIVLSKFKAKELKLPLTNVARHQSAWAKQVRTDICMGWFGCEIILLAHQCFFC